jgi:hypothetical protein
MLVSQVDTLKKNAERVNGKLKSMASLQFGDKWNTTSQSPQKNTVLTAILRTFWYRGESLEMTVADFNATLEEACMIVYECLDKHPSYQSDEQNILTRIIVQLTGNIANVKMAVVRQKGTYQNDPQKEAARGQLDDTITYIDDQLRQIREAVEKAGLKNKIDTDYRARHHKTRNPIIIGTVVQTSSELPNSLTIEDTIPFSRNATPATSPTTPIPINIPSKDKNVGEQKNNDSDDEGLDVF